MIARKNNLPRFMRWMPCWLWLLPLWCLPAGRLRAEPAAVPVPHRYVLVLDTAASMAKIGEASRLVISNAIISGLHGQMRPNDVYTFWTVGGQLTTNRAPLITWDAPLNSALCRAALKFYQSQKLEKRARFENLWPEIDRLVAAWPLVTFILITDGNETIKGSAFDERLNTAFNRYRKELSRTKTPFVVVMGSLCGQFTGLSMSSGDVAIAFEDLRRSVPELADYAGLQARAALYLKARETNQPAVSIENTNAVTAPTQARQTNYATAPKSTPQTNVQAATNQMMAPVDVQKPAPEQVATVTPPSAVATKLAATNLAAQAATQSADNRSNTLPILQSTNIAPPMLAATNEIQVKTNEVVVSQAASPINQVLAATSPPPDRIEVAVTNPAPPSASNAAALLVNPPPAGSLAATSNMAAESISNKSAVRPAAVISTPENIASRSASLTNSSNVAAQSVSTMASNHTPVISAESGPTGGGIMSGGLGTNPTPQLVQPAEGVSSQPEAKTELGTATGGGGFNRYFMIGMAMICLGFLLLGWLVRRNRFKGSESLISQSINRDLKL